MILKTRGDQGATSDCTIFSGDANELALKDEPLAAYLDDVALKALQLAEPRKKRYVSE
jgi:hypothetical protein